MAFRSIACIFFALSLFGAGGSPTNWTPMRGTAAPDPAVKHDGKPSIRLESPSLGEAILQSEEVKLIVGNRYAISGWLKTEGLEVIDLDRIPVATGASISMASMPWDVHSESLGGTSDWKRVSLGFTATRAEDRMEVRVASGGGFRGKAWMEGITLEDAPEA